MKHTLVLSGNKVEVSLHYNYFWGLIGFTKYYYRINTIDSIDWYDANTDKQVGIFRWAKLEGILKSYMGDYADLPIYHIDNYNVI